MAAGPSIPFRDENDRRYYPFSRFLRERFAAKVYRVTIDAGFTCPNVDGTVTVGGCVYCDNRSFSPNRRLPRTSIRAQVERGISILRKRYGAEKFLAYFQAATNTTLLIDFHLYGTIALDGQASGTEQHDSGGHGGSHGGGHGEKPAAGEDEFSKVFDKHKHRLRDQVITIIRSSELADYSDPSLGLIRRKILEKSNRLLGKPLLEEVIFSDFSIIEQ